MKPTPLEWLVASRYTLLIWVGLGLYLWFSQGGDWENFTHDQQIVFMIFGGVFALAYLKSFPAVFFYEREQALYRKSSSSPEERWRRSTVRQTLFLVLLAAALLYFGFQWWKSAPELQPASYKAAAVIGGGSLLATTAYLKIKPYFVRKQKTEQPFYVSWCLPIPSTEDRGQEEESGMELPDYCKQVLAAGEVRSPAQTADHEPEVKT